MLLYPVETINASAPFQNPSRYMNIILHCAEMQ
jgi:hypothetical protein